ncbi:MAG TPA: Gfo/Idh/MocA family oxidoreductase [Dokdonella sp.]|uniref:Gfo/Idh/MocA family protein n=1 Tax=Dokdonella sp. TaxID=2291710 RepID=UPI002D7FB62F|nr:Gfo/Idh/MocA family oxidoreductase [Dokdonella sp.]HET9031932.1 Gfo/Idh/MocA family oxidoreductase [Dokdonella sp.]
MQRRDFLKASLAVSALSLSPDFVFGKSAGGLRVGIIGTGMRGKVLLGELLKQEGVEIAALCDVDGFALKGATDILSAAGRPKARIFSDNNDAWREMLEKARLDAVIIATPWEWHAPMAIAAMQARVAVGCEVVAGVTLEDHWQVLRTQQRTGTPYMLLENVCFRRDVLATLNMVRQGVFGELMHLEGGYEHDLREVKLNSGVPGKPYGGGVEFGDKGWSEARWRTPHSVARNGELYPSHGAGPCAMWANINRGNRFLRLTSYASKSRGLHNHIVAGGGADHPNARVKFRLGDVVTTQLACENGETVLLTHDTSLPRPYSLGFRVQGTRGLWMDVNQSIYIEGKSETPHKWEPAQPWLDRYDHPLWKKFGAAAAGGGHGGMDFFVVRAFVEALKASAPMPINIYDAVTWSAITPLSEQSIGLGNRTVEFPDFTAGDWKTRKPIFALDAS